MWYNIFNMLTQKLYKNGNSIAVTIPKEYLKDLNLRDGSQVIVEKNDHQLIVTAKRRAIASGIDQKFARMVDEFISDHEDVLQELSNR